MHCFFSFSCFLAGFISRLYIPKATDNTRAEAVDTHDTLTQQQSKIPPNVGGEAATVVEDILLLDLVSPLVEYKV